MIEPSRVLNASVAACPCPSLIHDFTSNNTSVLLTNRKTGWNTSPWTATAWTQDHCQGRYAEDSIVFLVFLFVLASTYQVSSEVCPSKVQTGRAVSSFHVSVHIWPFKSCKQRLGRQQLVHVLVLDPLCSGEMRESSSGEYCCRITQQFVNCGYGRPSF